MFKDGIKARADLYARLLENKRFDQQFHQVAEILQGAIKGHSNDCGFESVFSRQIEALCQPGDVAIT